MRPLVRILVAAVALIALGACQPDPADAPPVGRTTTAATVPVPTAVSVATRQADFRLALFAARAQLENAWAACAADDRGCRERALGDYDATVAETGRALGLSVDEIVQLQPTTASAGGSAPLVQLGGSRG